MSHNRLNGGIPSAVGRLSTLKVLDLEDNRLTLQMPDALGNLRDLEELYLQRNNLFGSIPGSLGGLGELRLLHLNDNDLTGSIPPRLASLSSLQQLDLSNNGLSGSVPAALGRINKLVDINLDGNPLLVKVPLSPGPNAAAIAGDREALLALYNAMGGPQWTNSTNWNTNAAIGEWSGVTVATDPDPDRPNRTGRVVGLDLRSSNLTGDINDWISEVVSSLPVNPAQDQPLFWLETLRINFVSDSGQSMDNVLFIAPILQEVDVARYERGSGLSIPAAAIAGTVFGATVVAGSAASTVISPAVSAARWTAKVLVSDGRGVTFVARVAPVTTGPFGVAISVVQITALVLKTDTGGCVGETFYLVTGIVEQGVGEEVAFQNCFDALQSVVNSVAPPPGAVVSAAHGLDVTPKLVKQLRAVLDLFR